MIFQGSNAPILLQLPIPVVQLEELSIVLYHRKQELKRWNRSSVWMSGFLIEAPLTQQETQLFPVGACTLEIKWLTEGSAVFSAIMEDFVCSRQDKTLFPVTDTTSTEQNHPVLGHAKGVTCLTGTTLRKAYSPYIDKNTLTWWEYDHHQCQFVNTGVIAGEGEIPPVAPATSTTLGGIIVGDNLTISESGRLSVQTTDTVEQDNRKPITSAAVWCELGNVSVLLSTL